MTQSAAMTAGKGDSKFGERYQEAGVVGKVDWQPVITGGAGTDFWGFVVFQIWISDFACALYS